DFQVKSRLQLATSRSTRGASRALRQRGLAAARAAGPGSARIALGVEAHGVPLEEDTVRRAPDLLAAAAGLGEPFTTMPIDGCGAGLAAGLLACARQAAARPSHQRPRRARYGGRGRICRISQ